MRVGREAELGGQRCPTVAILLSANSMKSNRHDSTVSTELLNSSKPLSVSIYLSVDAAASAAHHLAPQPRRRFNRPLPAAAAQPSRLNLNIRVLMALPAWRQALALALRASDGDVSGCSLPPPRATATCTQRERNRTSFACYTRLTSLLAAASWATLCTVAAQPLTLAPVPRARTVVFRSAPPIYTMCS
jgi:hypothetical protein